MHRTALHCAVKSLHFAVSASYSTEAQTSLEASPSVKLNELISPPGSPDRRNADRTGAVFTKSERCAVRVRSCCRAGRIMIGKMSMSSQRTFTRTQMYRTGGRIALSLPVRALEFNYQWFPMTIAPSGMTQFRQTMSFVAVSDSLLSSA